MYLGGKKRKRKKERKKKKKAPMVCRYGFLPILLIFEGFSGEMGDLRPGCGVGVAAGEPGLFPLECGNLQEEKKKKKH